MIKPNMQSKAKLLEKFSLMFTSGLLLTGIIHGLLVMIELAIAQWQEPSLYGDSFEFLRRDNNQLLHWLTAQHNEHRILWAKATSLIETEVFQLPPGQSAVFQNLALILASAGLWSWLCKRQLKRHDLQLITSLGGWLLLINPWQYENLGWEFQTPWFLINTLVLLSALLLSFPKKITLEKPRRIHMTLIVLLPWIALSCTGQGLALSVSFIVCAWLHSTQMGKLASISTLLASFSFYGLLSYNNPAHHPEFGFNFDYFFRALLGGHWSGLALLCIAVCFIMLWKHKSISKSLIPSLLMPGLFSIIFTVMITLSRSGFGLDQANSSRYVTHSLMLGLTAIMALALVDDQNQRKIVPMLGGFLVLLTTIGSLPQALQSGGLNYANAWKKTKHLKLMHQQGLACHSQRLALEAANISLINSCESLYPDKEFILSYFKNTLPVKPRGWHLELVENSNSSKISAITHLVEETLIKGSTIEITGWAFAEESTNQQLYIIADYGISQKFAIPINKPRPDLNEMKNLDNIDIGFDAKLPLLMEGKSLRNISVGAPNKLIPIWTNSEANNRATN